MCWQPVRFIRTKQVCDFCWMDIPPGAPGSRTGERGTKAFYNRVRNVWECIECRSEATRAELARGG